MPEPATNTKHIPFQGATLKRLFRMLVKGRRLAFAVVVIGILTSVMGNVAIAWSLRVILDAYIIPMLHAASPDFAPFVQAILILLGIFLSSTFGALLYSRLMARIAQDFQRELRDRCFEHMQSLPISFFDQMGHGKLMSVYTNDIDALRQLVSQSIPQLVQSSLSIVSTLLSMLLLSPLLSLIAFVVIGLNFYTSRRLGGLSSRYFAAQQARIADVTAFVQEQMNGLRVVKVFNHEAASAADFAKLNEALQAASVSANRVSNAFGPVIGNLGNLQFVVTAFVGSLLLLSNIAPLTLGSLASFLQFTRNFNGPFMTMAQQMNALAMGLAGAERVFRIMDQPAEEDHGEIRLVNACYGQDGKLQASEERSGLWAWYNPSAEDGKRYVKLLGTVRLEHVTFAYEEGRTILHDINLEAKPGQSLAFVGATGAGKTTISNLINRFYDIQSGHIYIDDMDIRNIQKAALRSALGMVLQDTKLFTGSILENIRYGNLRASDEEVYAAAELAQADSFIRRLPQGYQTHIHNQDEELSEGQRQLLAIARAAVADPPILILDEATSSIDTRTERLVQRGMDNLMYGRTVFVIAHRLSTIRNSSQILLLDNGRIVERGKHEELIAAGGLYARLHDHKMDLD